MSQALVGTAVERVFAQVARLRRARAVHPRGALFDGWITVTERTSCTATALGGTGERPALVRLSKGAGTPGAAPDLLGVAVRVEVDEHVLDVLFTSAGRGRVTRWLLAPSPGWCRRPYTTLMPYRVAGRRVVLRLVPETSQRARGADPASAVASVPLAFTLTEQNRPIGRLVLQAGRDDEPVAFDPAGHTHPQLYPSRPLRRLRAAAYTGSRRGRGLPG